MLIIFNVCFHPTCLSKTTQLLETLDKAEILLCPHAGTWEAAPFKALQYMVINIDGYKSNIFLGEK